MNTITKITTALILSTMFACSSMQEVHEANQKAFDERLELLTDMSNELRENSTSTTIYGRTTIYHRGSTSVSTTTIRIPRR